MLIYFLIFWGKTKKPKTVADFLCKGATTLCRSKRKKNYLYYMFFLKKIKLW